MTIFLNVINAGFLMQNKYDQTLFYSPGPLPGTNGSSNPEKTQENIFVHDHQNNDQCF